MTNIDKLKRKLEAATSVLHEAVDDPGPFSYCLVIMSGKNAWYTFSACSPEHQAEINLIRGFGSVNNQSLQASSSGPSSSSSGRPPAADGGDKGPSR